MRGWFFCFIFALSKLNNNNLKIKIMAKWLNFRINVNSNEDYKNVCTELESRGFKSDDEWNDDKFENIECEEYGNCQFYVEVNHDIYTIFWVNKDLDTSSHYANLETFKEFNKQ